MTEKHLQLINKIKALYKKGKIYKSDYEMLRKHLCSTVSYDGFFIHRAAIQVDVIVAIRELMRHMPIIYIAKELETTRQTISNWLHFRYRASSLAKKALENLVKEIRTND